MMEAVRTSETSVDNHFTRQYIPENNSEHHTRRRENLKSHIRVDAALVGHKLHTWADKAFSVETFAVVNNIT
jgi:hypothetical protein